MSERGVVGGGVAFVISKLFGKADWIILTALLLISLIIVLDTKFSPIALWEKLREREGSFFVDQMLLLSRKIKKWTIEEMETMTNQFNEMYGGFK